jgi:hypothetical protein
MKPRTFAALLSSCLLSFSACGGGEGSSGVDGNKTLNNVTADEAVDLCEYANSRISDADTKKMNCYFTAIFQSETEEGCQTIFDSCIAAPDTEPVEDDCADAGSDLETLPECASMVTVAEVEACMNAQAADYSTLANSLSCTTPADELEEPPRPAACQALDEKCPGILD